MHKAYEHAAVILHLFYSAFHHLHLEKGIPMQAEHTKQIIQLVISDFLDNDFFTLNGLARELKVPIEALSDIYVSEHSEPSCTLALKLLQLHAQTFPALYARVK